jgi:hypothetical protein
VNAVKRLLEEYYQRRKPLGVAFAQDGEVLFGFGRPCDFALGLLSSSEGLCEVEVAAWDAVVFASSFRWGKRLVAQYALGRDATMGPPGSFVRLSVAVQHALDHPEESSAPPPTPNSVAAPRRPAGSPRRPLAAEADPEESS